MRSRTGATKIICFLGIVACCLLQLTAAVQGVSAAPKQVPGAKAGGCKACHQGDKMALAGTMPGSHVHQLTGVNCVGCHGKTEKPEALEMDKCVACHGSTAKLAEKTAKVKPENPHTSPHYGTELDCNLCHRQHAKSENYCNQCHSFNFRVP